MLRANEYICCFGEVLWDDFPSGRLPGGAPMNVAVGLQNLGVPALMISCAGDDALGRELCEFLKGKNCSTDLIQTDAQLPTGIVKVHAGSNGENRYEIVQPVAWDHIEAPADVLAAVGNAYALVFGSLVCRSERSKNSLMALLEKAKLKVFDVNFRAPFYSQTLVEDLMLHSDIVKMNDEELPVIAAWYGLQDQSELEQMHAIRQRFALQMCIVTKGANGAVVLDNHGCYQAPGFIVRVQDTVGSGDAFLAGFLKNLYAGHSTEEALMFACALGALTATHRGANPGIKESEVRAMLRETLQLV